MYTLISYPHFVQIFFFSLPQILYHHITSSVNASISHYWWINFPFQLPHLNLIIISWRESNRFLPPLMIIAYRKNVSFHELRCLWHLFSVFHGTIYLRQEACHRQEPRRSLKWVYAAFVITMNYFVKSWQKQVTADTWSCLFPIQLLWLCIFCTICYIKLLEAHHAILFIPFIHSFC